MEASMVSTLDRRAFLRSSALAAGSALTCTALARTAAGQAVPRIEPPVVDKLDVRVIVDGAHDVFIPEQKAGDVTVAQTRLQRGANYRRTLQSEWGLSLHLTSRKAAETRQYLLDFAYTPGVLINNIELLEIDLPSLDGLILSHGHLDHWGGLPGLLEKHRGVMKPDLPLYLGGEDAFCRRVVRGPGGATSPFGTLDRKELAAARLRLVLSEAPQIIDGHGFTTGVVPRTSNERVLPNSQVVFGVADGAGCDPTRYGNHHFTAAELSGQPQPDQHLHEHGTCFNVRGRGLVVITSCGHAGIINTVRRAREVSGVDKVYALVGGFHLAPAPSDYLARIMAELKALDIDHIFPMHCSGANFLELAKREMPQALVLCTTGSQFTFAA
jgi:7,8-dihydropterin-6-yl-methyl-4-(beta-D-ribofuranosyl)aminobenzene 5'-phosphate synthase